MIIVQGDMDTLVPVAGTRLWIEKMKDMKMTYEYVEVAGGDHGACSPQELQISLRSSPKTPKLPAKSIR